MRATKRVGAWVSPEIRERFRALADARGETESRCLGALVEAVIQHVPPSAAADSTSAPESIADRLTVRLRPGDADELQRLAARRGIRTSTYLAGLVRAHLVDSPVIPAPELAELARVLEAVSAIGRNLNQIARQLNSSGRVDPAVAATVADARQVVEDVRQDVKEYARVAAAAWDVSLE
jgi:Bacterial mobilisation protein (MobC)